MRIEHTYIIYVCNINFLGCRLRMAVAGQVPEAGPAGDRLLHRLRLCRVRPHPHRWLGQILSGPSVDSVVQYQPIVSFLMRFKIKKTVYNFSTQCQVIFF